MVIIITTHLMFPELSRSKVKIAITIPITITIVLIIITTHLMFPELGRSKIKINVLAGTEELVTSADYLLLYNYIIVYH